MSYVEFLKGPLWVLFCSLSILTTWGFLSNPLLQATLLTTRIIQQNKKLNTIESELNHDLKLCTEWLNANKLSLNIDKTKLLIFHSKKKKLVYKDISIKLNKTKLNPTDNVKYLGIFLDKNLSWDYQVIQLSKKLSRANGVLYKLRKYIPKETITSVYYSIFYSH